MNINHPKKGNREQIKVLKTPALLEDGKNISLC